MTSSIGKWTKTWAEKSTVPVTYHEVIDSTNDLGKQSFAQAGTLSLILADQQKLGRGRSANTWSNPDSGAALLSSWCFDLSAAPQPILAPLVGLALYKAVQATWPEFLFSIKAPNDLYLNEQKLAGILIETVERGSQRRLVIGLGLNVLKAPTDIATATCLQNSKTTVTEAQWAGFLDLFLSSLKAAVKKGLQSELTPSDCNDITLALNRRPGLTEEILSVDSSGQLKTASGLIEWHRL